MTARKKMIALGLIFCLAVIFNGPGVTAAQSAPALPIADTAAYLCKNVPAPGISSTGGEWTVIALARSGCTTPSGYFDTYYKQVENLARQTGGVLHRKKSTENSRVVLALTAIGRDPSNVGGYNLLETLGDYDRTLGQGINGPIFALLALDSGNYSIPACKTAKTQASRDMYIKAILDLQLADGGFALSGKSAEADTTGMALQALARYQDRPAVKTATVKALKCLSGMQDSSAGFQNWGATNVESSAQVLLALCELGIGINDSRFVKNKHTLADNLLSYYAKGSGFRHCGDGQGVGIMATEQSLCALVSLQRISSGQKSLYRMDDVKNAISKNLK